MGDPHDRPGMYFTGATRRLAEEGLFVEPSGAVTIAG